MALTKLTTWIKAGAIHHVFFDMDIPTRHRTTVHRSQRGSTPTRSLAAIHLLRITSVIDAVALTSKDPKRRPSWSVVMPRWALRSACPQIRECESLPHVGSLKISYRLLTETLPFQRWAKWKIVTPNISLSSVPYRARYISERLLLPDSNPREIPTNAKDPHDRHILARALSQALKAGWPDPTAGQAAGKSHSETDQFSSTYELKTPTKERKRALGTQYAET